MRNFQITISLQCDNLTIESNSPMRYPSLSTVQESNFVKSWFVKSVKIFTSQWVDY